MAGENCSAVWILCLFWDNALQCLKRDLTLNGNARARHSKAKFVME